VNGSTVTLPYSLYSKSTATDIRKK